MNKCKHKNAYVYEQTYDVYEGRRYDECYCPDCQTYFDNRVFQGKHNYQTKEEYYSKLKNIQNK